MRRLLPLCLLLALAALAGAPGRACAQPTGAVRATATILFPPLVGAGIKPLQFGSLVPGVPKTVLPNAAAAGEFRISGVRNRRSLSLTLGLPATLRNAANQALAVSFNGSYAANCEITTAGACDPVTYVAWNPVTTPTFNDTPNRSRPGRPRYDLDLFSVYVGGVALPTAGQPAGTYVGTISVTIAAN